MYRKCTYRGATLEDEFRIDKFRRFLPERGREGRGIIQFYCNQQRKSDSGGGMRTIDVSDIVRIR